MSKKQMILGMLAIGTLTFSIVATGCKKEEAKVEPTAAKPAQQEGKAPAATSVEAFKGQIMADMVPQTIKKGAVFELPVRVKNNSTFLWTAKGPNAIKVSYHWRDNKTNKSIVWDGQRTLLASDLPPNQMATIVAKVEAPAEANRYVLEMDLVMDKVGWFGKNGSEVSRYKVDVK